MARYNKYRPEFVEMEFSGDERSSWKWGGKSVAGREFVYEVTDHNFDRLNTWTFTVKVANDKGKPVVVQPRRTPGKKVWAGIERRSLVFVRANRSGYRGRMYCKVTLADPSGAKTKVGLRKGERSLLPPWMPAFNLDRVRLKGTVARTAGTDSEALVMIVLPEDHARMIRLFFGLKVWVLEEGFLLERV